MNQELVRARFDIVSPHEYLVKSLHDGVQFLIRFANGAGVSVVRHSGSYGFHSDLWEAAPILFDDNINGDWDFIGMAFELPGFNSDDVRGYLTPTDVDEILAMVASL